MMSTPPSSVPSRIAGIAWYREDDYHRITALMGDGASFPKTYASWQQKAVRMERELLRRGMKPVRIDVEPEAFENWCEQQGRPPDSDARNRYVEELAASDTRART